MQSLDCLRTHGLMVSFGNSSGKVEPFDAAASCRSAARYIVTRPTLFDFIRARPDLEAGCERAVRRSSAAVCVEIAVNQTYALRDAATAHRDLEARRTTGSTVLIP